jgi:hypothetical protein
MSLREEVTIAFSKTPYPSHAALTACGCDECRWEVSRLRGKRRSRLGWDNIGAEDANLSLLTPAAFHNFIPGLLLLPRKATSEGAVFSTPSWRDSPCRTVGARPIGRGWQGLSGA